MRLWSQHVRIDFDRSLFHGVEKESIECFPITNGFIELMKDDLPGKKPRDNYEDHERDIDEPMNLQRNPLSNNLCDLMIAGDHPVVTELYIFLQQKLNETLLEYNIDQEEQCKKKKVRQMGSCNEINCCGIG